ncbi:MAG: hypothetical protein JW769_03740 [Parachlamydiales bacterium]|nr:hypothetical protein [Parachlamydiales bacterium]
MVQPISSSPENSIRIEREIELKYLNLVTPQDLDSLIMKIAKISFALATLGLSIMIAGIIDLTPHVWGVIKSDLFFRSEDFQISFEAEDIEVEAEDIEVEAEDIGLE